MVSRIDYSIGILKTKRSSFQIAPPHSYINVEDFSSISELNNHLTYLANNSSAYDEYFWWRDHYQLETPKQRNFKAFCDLCQLLNDFRDNKTDQNHWTNLYKPFKEYWSSGICRPKINILP